MRSQGVVYHDRTLPSDGGQVGALKFRVRCVLVCMSVHVKWGLGPDCLPHLLNMVPHGVTGCVVRMLLAVVGCGSHAGHVVSMRVHVQQSQSTAVARRVDIAPAGPSEQRMVAQTRCECDPART